MAEPLKGKYLEGQELYIIHDEDFNRHHMYCGPYEDEEKVFSEKDIRSAIEWLKDFLRRHYQEEIEDAETVGNHDRISRAVGDTIKHTFELIDIAFEDVIKTD